MKIILVEDDPNKARQVASFIKDRIASASIIIRGSYTSGLREIREGHPDLVILDMSLPNFEIDGTEEGGRFRSYAGREILEQMRRRKINAPVIVLTQYETFSPESKPRTLTQLSKELSEKFSDIYAGAVYYNTAQDDWKEELIGIIDSAARGGARG